MYVMREITPVKSDDRTQLRLLNAVCACIVCVSQTIIFLFFLISNNGFHHGEKVDLLTVGNILSPTI